MWYSGSWAVVLNPALEILVDNFVVKIIVKASFYFYIIRVKYCIPEVSHRF